MKDRHVMVVDFYESGHHGPYLACLVRHWNNHYPDQRLTVCCVRQTLEICADLREALNASRPGVELVSIDSYLKPDRNDLLTLYRNDIRQGLITRALVEAHRPDDLILMYLDHLQISLGGRVLRFDEPISISGIYFRSDPDPAGLKDWLRAIRKRLVLRRAFRNPHFKRLLSLDPRLRGIARQPTNAVEIVSLPDPVAYADCSMDSAEARAELGLPPNAIVFMVFGVINGRKGVDVALRAISNLDESEQAFLMIAGPVDPDCRREIDASISRFGIGSRVSIFDNYLTNDQIAVFFAATNVLLLLYHDHVGSSNALVWAASSGTPVIATENGLIGHLVSKHQLGVTVNATDPEMVTGLMRARVLDPDSLQCNPIAANKFADQNSCREFGRIIFSRTFSDNPGSRSKRA